MTRLVVFVASGLLAALAGCANLAPQPPATPTAKQIAVFGGDVAATNLSAADYLNYGITSVEQNCATWFGHLVSGANTTSTLQQLLSLAGTAAGVAGGPIGAGAAAATSMGSAALGAVQANQPGGAMPAAIYTLVQRQLRAYVAAMPAPRTVADAAALIESAAEYCQGPGIAGTIMAAMITVPVSTVATVWAPANFGAAETAQGRVVPPVVVVGAPSTLKVAAEPASPERKWTRPKVRPAAAEEHLTPARSTGSMLRLIDDRRIDTDAQRKDDEEWRTTIGAWLARGRVMAEPPAPPATPLPEPIAPPEPAQAVPAPDSLPGHVSGRRKL